MRLCTICSETQDGKTCFINIDLFSIGSDERAIMPSEESMENPENPENPEIA